MIWAVLDCADGSLARIYFYDLISSNLGEYYIQWPAILLQEVYGFLLAFLFTFKLVIY